MTKDKKPKTKTIPLEYPIERDGKPDITEVTVKRAKAADIEAMDNAKRDGAGDVTQSILMISLLTGCSVEDAGQLDAVDFAAVAEAVGDFFGEAGDKLIGAA
jgi:hypothetical protein